MLQWNSQVPRSHGLGAKRIHISNIGSPALNLASPAPNLASPAPKKLVAVLDTRPPPTQQALLRRSSIRCHVENVVHSGYSPPTWARPGLIDRARGAPKLHRHPRLCCARDDRTSRLRHSWCGGQSNPQRPPRLYLRGDQLPCVWWTVLLRRSELCKFRGTGRFSRHQCREFVQLQMSKYEARPGWILAGKSSLLRYSRS